MNFNAQSIKLKMEEFKEMMFQEKPHIIGVTESWGQEWINDGLFTLKGYNLYRNDRKDRRGGGTLLYISNQLGQRECRPLNNSNFDSSIWCWVTPKQGKKILVGNVYRSDTNSGENNKQLLKLLESANDIGGDNRVIIMGDFNCPKVDWINKEVLPGAKKIERQIFEIMTDNLMTQHVPFPTRFRGTEKSTLDLIFTKEEHDVKNLRLLQPLGSSDHGVVIGDFICEWKSRVEPKRRRSYYRGDYASIINKLEQIDWVEKFSEKNTQECWEIFKSIVLLLVEEHIPMTNPRDHNEPWMNNRILRL